LQGLDKVILDPRDLKENYREYIQFFRIEKFSKYLQQHLESGYPKIYENYSKWAESVRLFNRHLINFIENSVIELDKLIEKERNENNLPEPETLYKYRIINDCFKKILIFWFPNPEYSKPTFEKLQNNEPIELKWQGATLIKASAVLCIKIEEFIKNFVDLKKEEVWKFYEDFENLKKKGNEIIEEIKIKIVDRAKYGGVIKGKCGACVGD